MNLNSRFARFGAAAVIAALSGVAAATPVTSVFSLSDHPDGNAAPPTYGLRMDGMGGNQTVVFSFVDVQLTVTDSTAMGGDLAININGTVQGGEVVGDAFADPELFTLNFDYVSNVEANAGGWRVLGTNNALNTGTIAPLSGGDPADVFTVTDNDDNAFIFAPDGHRLDGDNSTWVGRGWLTVNDDGNDSPGTQDWLFVAEVVPTPGTAALLAFGGLAATRRRR